MSENREPLYQGFLRAMHDVRYGDRRPLSPDQIAKRHESDEGTSQEPCRQRRRAFTVATDVKVYFCDPQSPWQRGTNENTNGLLRQYFPKKTDLSGYTQADLNKVALRLNQRPRKTLGFETPASKLQASVASTG